MDLTELRIAHPQAPLRSQAEHPDLALVNVAVHVVGGLPGLLQRVDPRQGRVDLALGDQPLPRSLSLP